MSISPTEAEEALVAIQSMVKKTRRAISASGAYLFLILWGMVWLLGFLGSQFLPAEISGYTWLGIDILGGALSAIIGTRMGKNVRGATISHSAKRIGLFWLLLVLLSGTALWVARPVDGKQAAMLIILFVMFGWMAMGLLLSFYPIWGGLSLTALALIGYFFLPDYFYLGMAILGGGGMIVMGLYIRYRW
ncbi:MAG: hypothetical protein PHQ40_06955 [Anaerolineaceae bacterium]|nr:hypothetical protein [Anaerolineaceae bacterium]